MDYRIGSERARIRKVVRNVAENSSTHTIFFKDQECAAGRPGQFVMIWSPGLDEMPMSLSGLDSRGNSSVTVKAWGPSTADLVKAKVGSAIGVRGPYGVPYTVERCRALLVGGGTGLAPLLPLAKALKDTGGGVTMVMGGRTKDELLFRTRALRLLGEENLFVTTDDGSYGRRGLPTEVATELIGARRPDRVYACGPEVMMRALYDAAAKARVEFEASLEREMKCGIGICGSCTIGKYLLCKDGPVMKGDALSSVLDEFGVLQRDAAGNYIKV